MELLYAEVLALVLGLVAHAALPGRGQTGVLLAPAVAAVAAAVVWVGLTWARVGQDTPLIWLASLGAAALSAAGLLVPLRRSRTRADTTRLGTAR